MGATQKTVGTANVRALCIACLAPATSASRAPAPTSSAATPTCRAPTDLGLDIANLPLYYGLTESAWKHWAASGTCRTSSSGPVRRGSRQGDRKPRTRKENMETPGITSTRWFDGVLSPEEDIDQRSPIKGDDDFRARRQHRHPHPGDAEGDGATELLVVADPHPTVFSA
jgi:formate dehydrogenase major subunit